MTTDFSAPSSADDVPRARPCRDTSVSGNGVSGNGVSGNGVIGWAA